MRIEFKCPGCGAVIEAEGRAGGSDVLCPGCGARLAVPPASAGPGVTIGGFRIVRLIGRGGMGEVFLARQLSLDRDVALKILPAHFANQRDDVERFLREMRLLAQLDHPHIATDAARRGFEQSTCLLGTSLVSRLDARLRQQAEAADAQAHASAERAEALAFEPLMKLACPAYAGGDGAAVDWFCSSSQTGLDLDLFYSDGLIDDLGPLAGLPIQSLMTGGASSAASPSGRGASPAPDRGRCCSS